MKVFVPQGIGRGELEERGSRFLSFVFPLDQLEMSPKEKVRELKEYHKDYSHVVHAFRELGARVEGAGDDGEPSGTSGAPILSFLRNRGIENVAVFVVRWFGGTKLGTGGLVRAYTESAKIAWENTPAGPYIPLERYSLELSYSDHRLFEELEKRGIFLVLQKNFTTHVQIEIEFPAEKKTAIKDLLVQEFQGRVLLL